MNNKRFKSAVAFTISMMTFGTLMIVALFATLINTTPTYASPPEVLVSDVTLPMAAFEDGQLKLFGFSETPQVIDENTNPFMSHHVWSPNGNLLAYVAMGAESNQLMLTDILGRTPQVIATGINSGMPLSFSNDNSQLIYAIVPDPSQATSINGNYTVDVMSHAIGSLNPPIKIGSFEQASCGGGGPLVYDALYWMEAGMSGIRPILTMTNSGIIHSITCQGVGVAILNTATGEETILDSDITRVRLSADGQTLLGVSNDQLMLIDIATGESSTIATDVIPDQVIWGTSDTGNIYYSVRTATDEIISYTADEQQKILNATGIEASELVVNQVSIHRFNLDTNLDEIVYENTAYAVGHMTLLPDNRLLMVSEVPSLVTWFDAVLEASDSNVPQLETELNLVSLEDGETRSLGTGLSVARLNDDAYVRQFGISPQVFAQPTTVNIGTQIKILGLNFPAQSRVLIYMGTDANTLDETAYASGFTNASGEVRLSFSLPTSFQNGQAIDNGQLLLVAETSDELFSAETRITVDTNATETSINTGLATPSQSLA